MKKILVIEDEEEIREILVEILSGEDFEVIDTEDGHRGISLARDLLPDLIVCDIMMPNIDGYEVLSQLRQNSSTESIPFIFLTAKAAKDDLRHGMQLGADDYLTKPFTRDELVEAISVRLEKQVVVEKQSQQKLDELRTNLTHSLPHELLTPINGILGFSKFLLDSYDSLEREAVLEMLEAIYTSSERLYQLTQNFLLYAELDLITSNPEQVQALRNSGEKSHIKDPITDVARQKAQQFNREADLLLGLREARVQLPSLKLKKIVEEVIDNAFKFSAAGTPVCLLSNFNNDTFNLSIINSGRGMTAEQIANLGAYMQFERKFYEQQGSGLGLTIAKRLAELYGGKLTIESVPGEQTIVQISLPGSSSI